MKAVVRLVVVALSAMLAGCAHAPTPADPVARAATWLQGDFDNLAQARADPRFRPVVVRWTPLWPGRTDGRWFLVEQALAATPARPYRRRVHRLRGDGGDGVVVDVHLLPVAFTGRDAATLSPADLRPRPGCALYLRPAAGGLRGATRGRDCTSAFRGARWASAEVLVTPAGFASWDRGFDGDGRQVWGARSGPYAFARSLSR